MGAIPIFGGQISIIWMNKMIRALKLVALVLVAGSLIFADVTQSEGAEPLFAFALPASGGFFARDYEKALDEVVTDTTLVDTGIKFFKQGIAHFELQHYPEALFCFRYAAEKNPAFEGVAYEYIGDIVNLQGDTENAIHAYRAALNTDIPPRYARHLREKIFDILKSDSLLASKISWFTAEEKLAEISQEEWLPEFLDTLLSTEQIGLADSILDEWLRVTGAGNTCRIYRVVVEHELPESLFTTEQLFRLSEIADDCRKYSDASDWLHASLKRNDFDSLVEKKRYLAHRAMLNYHLENYSNAIRWFGKYEDAFGLIPEHVLTVARSYRALKKSRKSAIWYDKHVELFPDHRMTVEILWYRAWQKEDAKDYKEAIERFSQIWKTRPRSSKADESYFRTGICAFKGGMFSLAEATFEKFLKKYPRSSLVEAATYWHARSLLEENRKEKAVKLLRDLVGLSPWDYYAHRARELLTTLDSTQMSFGVSDSLGTISATRAWLASVSEREKISAEDSANWVCGVTLALCGRTDLAVFFLEPFEYGRTKDLSLQYDLAMLYDLGGDPALSFRIARRFAWRLPSEQRGILPAGLWGVLFPFPYEDLIVRNAATYDVDPKLVTSVMRQESIFDRRIVSPVGAIGLMQIMPYTGEDIARRLNDTTFSEERLYEAEVNIRYGTFYLRELLKQFDDNLACAVSAYNGGPHNAKRWHERNKDLDFDLYVESVGFSETRNYVKKVLGNYWTYELIGKYLGYPGF